MVVIGIDPGKLGALAIIADGYKPQVFDMPCVSGEIDKHGLIALLKRIEDEYGKIDAVVVEDVHAMPKQSSIATFSFGISVGIARMVAPIVGAKEIKVTPQKWKKYFSINGGEKKELKQKAVLKARELFPSLADLLIASKDGRSESLLIAEYGRANNLI